MEKWIHNGVGQIVLSLPEGRQLLRRPRWNGSPETGPREYTDNVEMSCPFHFGMKPCRSKRQTDVTRGSIRQSKAKRTRFQQQQCLLGIGYSDSDNTEVSIGTGEK